MPRVKPPVNPTGSKRKGSGETPGVRKNLRSQSVISGPPTNFPRTDINISRLDHPTKVDESRFAKFSLELYSSASEAIGIAGSLNPLGNPCIDIERLEASLLKCTSGKHFCEVLRSIMDTSKDYIGMEGFYRSAKNFVLCVVWLDLSIDERELVTLWIKRSEGLDPEDRKKMPGLETSVATLTNFIGYDDTQRFRCNMVFLFDQIDKFLLVRGETVKDYSSKQGRKGSTKSTEANPTDDGQLEGGLQDIAEASLNIDGI